MRAVICKGDRTSHGGRVLEGNPNVTTGGKQIAQLGHSTICPLCKGKFPIIEGVATHTYGGKPTAVHGMKTACGATLIASQQEMLIDTGASVASVQPNQDAVIQEAKLARMDAQIDVVMKDVHSNGERLASNSIAPRNGDASAPPDLPTASTESKDNLLGKIVGGFEVPATIASGIVGGTLGAAYGVVKTLASGKYGTKEGIELGEQAASHLARQITMSPSTNTGRYLMEKVSQWLDDSGIAGLGFSELNALGAAAGMRSGNTTSRSSVNADLLHRTAAYKNWKSANGLSGRPTRAQFSLFPSSQRLHIPGFAAYSGKEWPPNMGFREVFDAYLDVGYKFDRYGYGGGRFVSPAGTSYRGRALRPGSDKLPYNTYEVIFPLQVKYGPARAWFGYEGGVAQMLLPDSIDNLLARGWIRKN